MMMPILKPELSYVFFGTGEIAKGVLDELLAGGLRPALVVSAPDRPAGRGLAPTPTAVSATAMREGLSLLKPRSLDHDLASMLEAGRFELFVVADYGVIIPKALLDIPHKGTLNMHPSLLPRLRGPSPIRSAILQDEKTVGVSIILLDENVDHGPILAQKKVPLPEWPPRGKALDLLLAHEGGRLLAQILPLWVRGEVEPRPQHHDLATYCRQFTKEDGLLNLAEDGYKNLLKIRAFEGWPGTYAFFDRGGTRIRVQVIEAHMAATRLVIDTVKPEGKKEMPYADFLRSGATLL